MKLIYTTTGTPTIDSIKTCDEGAKAFQALIMHTAKLAGPKHLTTIPVIWLLTRFYKRIVTGNQIIYDFYLMPGVVQR